MVSSYTSSSPSKWRKPFLYASPNVRLTKILGSYILSSRNRMLRFRLRRDYQEMLRHNQREWDDLVLEAREEHIDLEALDGEPSRYDECCSTEERRFWHNYMMIMAGAIIERHVWYYRSLIISVVLAIFRYLGVDFCNYSG